MEATELDAISLECADDTLDTELGEGYGIFSGKPTRLATLLFSRERTAWVKTEHWHPKQEGKMLDDGRFQLSFPYSDHRELVMDILKHGAHCHVISPAELKAAVAREIDSMSKLYF